MHHEQKKNIVVYRKRGRELDKNVTRKCEWINNLLQQKCLQTKTNPTPMTGYHSWTQSQKRITTIISRIFEPTLSTPRKKILGKGKKNHTIYCKLSIASIPPKGQVYIHIWIFWCWRLQLCQPSVTGSYTDCFYWKTPWWFLDCDSTSV